MTPNFRTFLGALLAVALFLCVGMAYAGTATLSWTAPTKRTDGAALTGTVTYKVYRGTSAAAVAASTTPIGTSATTGYTDASAPSGTQFYAVTAVDAAGVESAKTNAVSVVIPVAPPEAPTALSVTVQVADTNAYKQRFAVDSYSLVAFGSVPVGTPLDTSRTVTDASGTYCAVQRAAVTPRSRFEPLPLIAFARCG